MCIRDSRWTDPHLGPCRRDGELADARQNGGVAHRPAFGVDVAEPFAGPLPANPGALVAYVRETRLARAGKRLLDRRLELACRGCRGASVPRPPARCNRAARDAAWLLSL